MVLLEEVNETILEVWPQMSFDLNFVIQQVGMDWNLIEFFYGRLIWSNWIVELNCNCLKVEGLALMVL